MLEAKGRFSLFRIPLAGSIGQTVYTAQPTAPSLGRGGQGRGLLYD
jgi:hypothetical protein